jgi:hypothetical protein
MLDDKGNVVKKKYEEMTEDEIKTILTTIKTRATKESKEELFGEKPPLTDAQKDMEYRLKVARAMAGDKQAQKELEGEDDNE